MSETYLGIVHDNRMTPHLRQFIEFLKQGKLMGNKCKKCGKKFLPPRAGCQCGSTDMEWFEVNPEGTLYAWTIVHVAPDTIARKCSVPYVVGVVEFEDGLKIASHIRGLTRKPEVGMKVKIAPENLPGGDIFYKIVPA